MRSASRVLGGLVVCLASVSGVTAQDATADFHKAYYLEMEEGKLEEAAALYARVAGSNAPGDLVERARARLAACRELLHGADLSRLMPPDVLSYVELRDPGRHLTRILKMAGLTPETAIGQGGDGSPLPVVVSPRLLKSLEAVPALAVATTNVHPRLGIPSAVAVLNLGRSDLAHGAVETALSTAVASNFLQTGETVEGHTAYMSPFGTIVTTERFVILEDTIELRCTAPNRVALRTSEVADLTRLVRATMRLRPDAIIVGEVRGREALDMLKAWNTGHPGGMCTVHANSARAALSRLDQLVQEAGVPSQPFLLADAVDLVVALRERHVREVLRVQGYDPTRGFELEELAQPTTRSEGTP